jgi:cytochrome c-type biogenesis protein
VDPGLLALALVAGAVAALNPCGFALLPAYLSLLVAAPQDGSASGSQLAAIGRAARFTAGMTTGFVAVFGTFGLVVAPLALSVEQYLPVVTLFVGAVLLGAGIWLLSGRSLIAPRLLRRGRAPGTSWRSQIGYGVAFALASLSCTIGPFLAVTAGAVRAGGTVALLTTYVTYAVGMGAVVGLLAIAAATASSGLTARVRGTGPFIARASGALLVLAGAYVAWYGWFELRVLAGASEGDPVIEAATGMQAALARGVASIGWFGIVAVATGVAAVVALSGGRRHLLSRDVADRRGR